MKKNRVKAVLKDKGGFSYILVCVIILVTIMAINVFMEYAHVYSVADRQEAQAKLVMDSFITKESVKDYNAWKQGVPYRRYIDETALVTGAYTEFREVENGDDFSVESLSISSLAGDRVGVVVRYELLIPFEFMGATVTDIHVPIEFVSKMERK